MIEVLSGFIGMLCVGCTDYDRDKLLVAQKFTNKMVQSQCFAREMKNIPLEFTFGRTPDQVVKHLKDSRPTAYVHYYYEVSSVVGSRTIGTNNIYLNNYFHDEVFTVCDQAGNIMHEVSHILGYDHFVMEPISRRNKSVPYAINQAFYNCCNRVFVREDLDFGVQ